MPYFCILLNQPLTKIVNVDMNITINQNHGFIDKIR